MSFELMDNADLPVFLLAVGADLIARPTASSHVADDVGCLDHAVIPEHQPGVEFRRMVHGIDHCEGLGHCSVSRRSRICLTMYSDRPATLVSRITSQRISIVRTLSSIATPNLTVSLLRAAASLPVGSFAT